MKAYWFSDNGVAQYGDFVPFEVRPEPYRVDGTIVPCENGLHASAHPFDALRYAHGNTLDIVILGGEIVPHETDKLAASERTHIARIDAEPVLRDFARWCALQVVRLWDCPDVVLCYLETGDESLRDAARAAAWAAAKNAARAAAGAAAIFSQRAKLQELVDAAFAAQGVK